MLPAACSGASVVSGRPAASILARARRPAGARCRCRGSAAASRPRRRTSCGCRRTARSACPSPMPGGAQQGLQIVARHQVSTNGIGQLGRPVEAHRAWQVALVIGAGVDIDLDESNAGISEMLRAHSTSTSAAGSEAKRAVFTAVMGGSRLLRVCVRRARGLLPRGRRVGGRPNPDRSGRSMAQPRSAFKDARRRRRPGRRRRTSVLVLPRRGVAAVDLAVAAASVASAAWPWPWPPLMTQPMPGETWTDSSASLSCLAIWPQPMPPSRSACEVGDRHAARIRPGEQPHRTADAVRIDQAGAGYPRRCRCRHRTVA